MAALVPAFASTSPARAADLHSETVQAFDHYIHARDKSFADENKSGAFLWLDRQADALRAAYYEQLRRGETVIERIKTEVNGEELDVPDGIIHDWIGVVFIPGAKLSDTLRLLEDYDHHAKYFAPDVSRSKLLKHDGNSFKSYLRFYKKKVLTVVLDTDHEAVYDALSPTRAISRSWTTRIQEVENHDQADERLEPVGHDGGYMWRLNTYWRFEEKDGGTYVECEGITLTREIPLLLKPLIGPYVSSIPKESLLHTLGDTRKALEESAQPAAASK